VASEPSTGRPVSYSAQLASGGTSARQVVDATLEAARPQRNLSWLDVGCGRGQLLRRIRDEWEPQALYGLDPISWLADDLRPDVTFYEIAAEDADGLPLVDRVLLATVIEHLEAPWRALRKAAHLVAPGGRIVVSTPNVGSLRSRLQLAARGNLAAFRPEHEPHISPALPHVISRILTEEGLVTDPPSFAGGDMIPFVRRAWPGLVQGLFPVLASKVVVVAAERPAVAVAMPQS